MKKLAMWLKFLIIIVALSSILFFSFVVPLMTATIEGMPITLFMWVTALPFYIALWFAWKICSVISEQLFSEQHIKHLKNISYLAMSEIVLYAIGIVYIIISEQATITILAFCLLFLGMAVTLTLFLRVLANVFQEAKQLEEEAKLTI
ncbi:DUF2975 domain-containing protein [Lysinibacillus mangiferihumi]|uniref:DUF2975 domain-containing protein n=1 Tax=Lysinibacillus mangiferihumi TaxID=1130819 RepID=A0A4U2Z0F1_9BACI|nr:DUF2975 domain-containing protein [Lysinibacillus mangiferihumi]TKI66900.1 DUF2975 domain-containing protein [Lysinibacillus mangiferihumi]